MRQLLAAALNEGLEILEAWPTEPCNQLDGARELSHKFQHLARRLLRVGWVVNFVNGVELLNLSLEFLGGDFYKGEEQKNFRVVADRARIWGDADKDDVLMAQLPRGMMVRVSGVVQSRWHEGHRALSRRWNVRLPFVGWVDEEAVEMLTDSPVFDWWCTRFWSTVYHVRQEFAGKLPMGMCGLAALKLREQFHSAMRDIIEDGRLGPATVVNGSFLVETEARPWWPPGYRDWHHHSFLQFADGSILDITADQFEPRLP